MTDLTPIEPRDAEIWRPSAALNPERLEYLWGLSERIAWSTSVNETLRGERKGGTNGTFEPFDDRTILANVFAVVEQADRWNVSPFALLGSAAIVRGKLAFEGKVIAAVMEAQFGVKLYPYYRGEPRSDGYHIYLCDEELPESILAELEPGYRHDRYRIMDGSVGAWKTTNSGSPWKPDTYADMLIYRGSRQWARVYKSAAILGVIADDEVQQLALENAAQTAVPIGQRFAPTGQGFNADGVAAALEHKPTVAMEIVDRETAEVTKVADLVTTTVPGAQPEAKVKTTSPGPAADKAPASAKPAENSAGTTRDGQTNDGGRPTETPSSAAPATLAADGTGGDAAPPSRVSADTFRDYYSALARMATKENVVKAHQSFFSGKGIKLAHPDDLKLAKDIHDNNLLRVEGKKTAEVLKAEVDSWIAQVCGGAL